MSQILQPGSVPAWSGDDPASDIDNVFAEQTWPVLSMMLVYSYANAAARDAELAGLSPTQMVLAYLKDEKRFTYWNGTDWAYLSATSTSKAGKRIQWGTATVTTDATGFATVTHGAGFTPTVVLCNLGRTSGALYDVTRTSNYTSTQFTIRVLDNAGATVNSTSSIPVTFFCGE